MGKAEPGQVLTTSDLLERSRSTFETVELEPLTLKGIAEPVTAFDVVGVSGTAATEPERPAAVRRPRARADDPLGRARAGADGLRQPGRADRRARHGQVAARRGAPGAGAGPARRDDRRARSTRPSTPYFAFRGLLRSLLELPQNGAAPDALRERVAELDPELVPWLPLVALPLDVQVEPTQEVEELQPAFRRARLHGVVESVLVEAARGPDAARDRGRALDGRGVGRAPAPPRRPGLDAALARLRDPPAGRGRLLGGGRRASDSRR